MIKYAKQQQAQAQQQQQQQQQQQLEEANDPAAERERRTREEEERRRKKKREEARKRREAAAAAEAIAKNGKHREVSPLIQRILEDHWIDPGLSESDPDVDALLSGQRKRTNFRTRHEWGAIFE